ncbi:gluconate permease [Sporolactobacillus shoreae]|uniref:Gluconate permease n=1 Tax=Sporolactobacillus shoreae TaxID=1465501 RepID=A0A4Z0GT63_9BACL|nr:gluconate:H+ symporter [Sporolactobacillus shoreae]TGA99891.1 gluconate permease [Sporolactobacillus shoreae]
MPIIIICVGVALLLLLMIVLKVNAFISLILVSIAVGIMEGMSPIAAITSVKTGLGGTLGSLAMVLGFGAILGKLMADSGGAHRIALTLINKFGKKRVQWAAVLTGFIVGIALFYEVGFVILIPLAFTIAIEAGLPILYIGMPVVAALITVHGFLPPHPGPTAIATVFHANLGKTLLYGIILAIPAVIAGGPLFTKFFKEKDLQAEIPKALFNPKKFTEEEMPSFSTSLITAIIPVILMSIQALVEIFFPKSSILSTVTFFGEPSIALLLSVIIAFFTLGIFRGKKLQEVMRSVPSAISSISMIILIIGGGGALKQVIIDSGVDKYIAHIMQGSTLSPLLLTWLIAAILRVSLGSATVAGLTAAGISAPLIGLTHVSPELMVLATGAGSITFSHVNDAGFWIYKEYFNLSIGKTIKTWSIMVTILSLVGLAGVLILNLFI